MDVRTRLMRYGRLTGEVRDGFDDRITTGGGMGTAPTGQRWREIQGSGGASGWGIIGGQAYTASSTASRHVVDAGFADGSVQATLVNQGAGNTARLIARLAHWEQANCHEIFVAAGAANWTLNRRAQGSNSILGTYAVVPVNGDVVRLRMAGASLEVYINDTLRIGPVVDGWSQGSTRVGFTTVNDTAVRWDAFSVTRY